MSKLTRRAFLVTGGLLGGGLALGYFFTPNRLALRADSTAEQSWLTSWVSVNADNTITVLVPQAEMGQGILTALPMMLAEEMEADWSLVSVEPAPAEDIYVTDKIARGFTAGEIPVPGSLKRLVDYSFYKVSDVMNLQITGGSASVRFTGQWGMRVAGAAAREMLISAAAKEWGVASAECYAKLSHVHHDASGRYAGFAELAGTAATLTPSLSPKLKNKKDYTICGRAIPRVDIPEKVDGSLEYGIDLKLDGLKVAAVRHAPVFGGDIASYDSNSIEDLIGIEDVLQIPGAVVVTADNYWRAKQGVTNLAIEFSDGENGNFNSEDMFKDFERIMRHGDKDIDHEQGNISKAFSASSEIIEAEYRVPFLAHATMEPMNCTAHYHDGKLEVWTGTQDPLGTRALAAETAGLDMKDVTVYPLQLGGGFGRRIPSTGNFIEDAVHAAMQVPYPVKVIWSREEDIQHDYYRPAGLSRFKATLDRNGMPMAWQNFYTDIGVNGNTAAAFIPYNVPHQQIGRIVHETPVPVSYWRSVEHSYQGFFTESFIDEMAYHANVDPLAYRLKLLDNHPRHRELLKLVAEKIDWGRPLPDGSGTGIAIVESFGTIVVEAAQITLKNHGVRVDKVVAAADPGEVINPATAKAQIQSGIIYGLSAALYGRIDIDKGRVAQSNFPNYEMVRLSTAPEIEVYFIESGATIGGMGEVGTPPMAPALSNAIFAANGQRIRRLPVNEQRLNHPV